MNIQIVFLVLALISAIAAAAEITLGRINQVGMLGMSFALYLISLMVA